MDAIEQIWWLEWAAHSLLHGQNIFFTKAQNYPAGQNFGVQGSMLALGVIFSPVTRLFGPLVTWNVALRFAPAISAASMCFVLRRWTEWWPSAFVGGLLYGFSSYAFYYSIVGGGYLFLTFVPLPPLALLLLHEIVVRRQWRFWIAGCSLALVLTLQFFISTEVLASTVLVGAIALIGYVVFNRRKFLSQWRYSVWAFACALGLGSVLLSFPAAYTFAGPQHLNGTPEVPATLASAPGELLAAVVPNRQWLHFSSWTVPGEGFSYSGSLYLGIPLIVTVICLVVVFRKRGPIVFAAAMAIATFILSLGAHLNVDGRDTIAFPFELLVHVPILQGLQANRLSLYTTLFVSAVLALGIDRLWARWALPRDTRFRSPRLKVVAGGMLALIALAVFLPLVIRHPRPNATAQNIPAFFTSNSLKSVPAHSVVLAYPYPDAQSTGWESIYSPGESILLDQAITGMRFDVLGGYGWFPSPLGHNGTTNPLTLEPRSVQALFDVAYTGGTPAERNLLKNTDIVMQLRQFLRRYDVQSVIVVPVGGHPAMVASPMTAAIGSPTETGGVVVWTHVADRLHALSN
jgi:hypothetical protein